MVRVGERVILPNVLRLFVVHLLSMTMTMTTMVVVMRHRHEPTPRMRLIVAGQHVSSILFLRGTQSIAQGTGTGGERGLDRPKVVSFQL